MLKSAGRGGSVPEARCRCGFFETWQLADLKSFSFLSLFLWFEFVFPFFSMTQVRLEECGTRLPENCLLPCRICLKLEAAAFHRAKKTPHKNAELKFD
jgi:hypothetical protein